MDELGARELRVVQHELALWDVVERRGELNLSAQRVGRVKATNLVASAS